MSRFSAAIATFVLAAAVMTATAHAQTELPSGNVEHLARPSTLSAHFRTLAYSAYDPATDTYRLRVKVGSQPPRDVPVAPRSVPFDVDAGRAFAPPEGHEEVLVYSRCRTEPRLTGHRVNPEVDWRSARGCRLYRATSAGHEQRIKDAGEGVLPALSGSTLAAVRERGTGEPIVVIHRLRATPGVATVVHGPATHGAAGPTHLGVAAGQLAITWAFNRTHRQRDPSTRLSVVDTATGKQRRTVRSLGGGGLSSSMIIGATWARDGSLRWAESCSGDPSGCVGHQLIGGWRPGFRTPRLVRAPSGSITAFTTNGVTAWTVEKCPLGSLAETGSGCVVRERPLPPLGAAAASTSPAGQRPRAMVATYLRHGLRVTQLFTDVRRGSSRLQANVQLSVHNDSSGPRRVGLLAGSCVGGSAPAPRCPPSLRRSFVVPAGGRVLRRLTVHLPLPAKQRPAIELLLTSGKPTRAPRLKQLVGRLLLPARAWREPDQSTGFGYGIILSPTSTVDVQRASLVGAEEDRRHLRASFALQGVATVPSPVELILSGALSEARPRDELTFGPEPLNLVRRPDLLRQGSHSTFGAYVVGTDSRTRLQIALPWPD